MASDGDGIDAETISENLMEPVFALDTSGTIVFANARFLTIAQVTPEEVLGADQAFIGQFVESGFADLEAAIAAINRGEREDERVELDMCHPESAPVPRRVSAQARVTPITDDGTHVGVLVTLRDVSDLQAKRRELQRQNDRLVDFAGVVSHDLRNPLNVAMGHVAVLGKECDTEPLDLESVVTSCWAQVTTASGKLVVEDSVGFDGDPERLRQVFENLFRNAVDHGGDAVTVRVGRLPDGFYVEDDGEGIPDGTRDTVFDPGETTDPDGTGFGLAIVADIVRAHGWEIRATESADGGARFEITGVDTE